MGVVDLGAVSGKISASHGQSGDTLHHRAPLGKTQPFVVQEVEGLVLSIVELWRHNRAAIVGAEIVHDQFGFGFSKRTLCVKSSRFVIIEGPAVRAIRSVLGNRGDVADSAELGSIAVLAYPDLLDRIEGGKEFGRRNTRANIHGANAIDGDRQQARLGACNGDVAGGVGLHADQDLPFTPWVGDLNVSPAGHRDGVACPSYSLAPPADAGPTIDP